MPKVLIADDDPEIRMLCEMILSGEDYVVFLADDASTCVASARNNHPDLILLDWMMPDVDGLDCLRTLKASPRTESIPVIMLTALDGMSNVLEATTSGADGYVTKPFEPDDLLSLVRRFTHVVS